MLYPPFKNSEKSVKTQALIYVSVSQSAIDNQ